MVKPTLDMGKKTNSQSEYDRYWSFDDRLGESSGNMHHIAEQIILTCGLGRTLDIGSGEGLLVASLLRRGVDAYGLDMSEVVTARCNGRLPGRFTHGSVLDLPFDDASFPIVVSTDCMEHLAPEDVPKALREIYRVADRYVFFQLATTQDRDGRRHLTVEGRAWWEAKCFEAGFRKHPAYYEINNYESLNSDSWQILIVLEKIPATLLEKYPLAVLAQERDLHMDMLRETGRRSDGHVFHYHFASKYVRPGDIVLDAACGLGYGSHVLYSNSFAKKVIGIDLSSSAIQYASLMFGCDDVSFKESNVENLLALENNSVDLIASFETLEHVQDPHKLLAEFSRVLRPTGRLILSVPNLWVDETGKDPNPWHFHVYDWEILSEQLSRYFLIEERFDQIAGGGFKLSNSPRIFKRFNNDKSGTITVSEWLVVVAIKSSKDTIFPFKETVYPYSKPPTNLLDFSSNYENAWLVREICDSQFRIKDPNVLLARCHALISCGNKESADYGASLCIYGYRLQEKNQFDSSEYSDFEVQVENYLDIHPHNPHIFRWQTSLAYLMGVISMSIGNREKSRYWFERCIASDYLKFSPVLATKVVSAARSIGFLLLSLGDENAAVSYFIRAMTVALDALKAPTEEWIGKVDFPLTCTYFDAMQLLDDGMHSAVIVSQLMSGRGSRIDFYRFLFRGGYRSSLQSQVEALNETNTANLSDLNRLGADRQELFDVAEQRLSDLHRLGAERQELFDVAEQRLSEMNRLGAERQELFDVAEQRLSEMSLLTHRIAEAENLGLRKFLLRYFYKRWLRLRSHF
jgi:ubiquinone/menaquinone biosynthesis C-methylase UbiE